MTSRSPDDRWVDDIDKARAHFHELVVDIRPDLHRYCARMTGSVADGEDIVQETLARAFYAISEQREIPALRPWLFRIAHSRAIDFHRRYDRRMGRSIDEIASVVDMEPHPEDALAHEQAMQVAISQFVSLPPLQRSAVILKDVLDLSLDEIATLLDSTIPAVKAALHRGRVSLRADANEPIEGEPRRASPEVMRYVKLFNARDWDGVRGMLVDDVRLDLVGRAQRIGRSVGEYFTNYDRADDWHLVPAWLDGREAIAVFASSGDARPRYFIELDTSPSGVVAIRDFRYVPYIAIDANVTLMPAGD